MTFEYRPKGVCSSRFIMDINEDDTIANFVIENGCPGNTMGISKIIVGMNVDDVIKTFDGIDCNGKGTSCPDQVAKALSAYKEHKYAD